MPDPKIQAFLKYNKDNIFKNLIQAEDHFRNIRSPNSSDWTCIVKHLAFAEGEAEEAISHTLSLGDRSGARLFSRLRDEIRELRWKIQEGKVRPEEGLLKVRELRKTFERAFSEYNTSECKACPEPGEVAEKISSLWRPSEERNIFIGKTTTKERSGGRMATWREVGVIYGGAHIGKGLTRLAKEVDRVTGRVGAPVHTRPSTWINVVGAVALPFLGVRYVGAPWDIALVAAGAQMSTELWDIIEELMATRAAGLAVAPAPAPAPAPVAPAKSQAKAGGPILV